jgi:thioredoxin reductase (NADPH)
VIFQINRIVWTVVGVLEILFAIRFVLRLIALFGTRVKFLTRVESADLSCRPFTLTVEGEKIQTRCLIVAVGAGHKHLDVLGEHELENKGVTFCATCDGALPVFRNKPLVVVGGGDSACEEAMFLTLVAGRDSSD